jgi:uncharacterized protein (DUF2164 family)
MLSTVTDAKEFVIVRWPVRNRQSAPEHVVKEKTCGLRLPSLFPFCTDKSKQGATMSIEISSEATNAAIGSIQRYFAENMDEPIGNLAAGALLSFMLKEIGPVVYNKAIADAQARLQERVAELDVDV